MNLSNHDILRINEPACCVSEHSIRATMERESDQRCQNIVISSRRWQKEGKILPVLQASSAG